MLANCAFHGVQYAFYGRDILNLVKEDVPCARPTLFIAVPRLLNKMYDNIKRKFSQTNFCAAYVLNKVLSTKL